MCVGFYVKYPLFLSDFDETGIFSTDFPENILISWKCDRLEPSSSRTDRRDEVNSRFLCNFANDPKTTESNTTILYRKHS